jgi:hypothetical protein
LQVCVKFTSLTLVTPDLHTAASVMYNARLVGVRL